MDILVSYLIVFERDQNDLPATFQVGDDRFTQGNAVFDPLEFGFERIFGLRLFDFLIVDQACYPLLS